MLADDHRMVRESLARVLETDPAITVVGQAGNGDELLQIVATHRPEILIMDYSMPQHPVVESIEHFLTAYPELRIVVLTVHENTHYAVQVLQAGAHGYLIKSAAVDELIEAIETVRHGNVYVSRQIADRVWQQMRSHQATKTGLESLSTRELEVLKALAEGTSLSDCATQLGIKTSTVSTYRSRLMEKLALESTSDLIRYAILHHVID